MAVTTTVIQTDKGIRYSIQYVYAWLQRLRSLNQLTPAGFRLVTLKWIQYNQILYLEIINDQQAAAGIVTRAYLYITASRQTAIDMTELDLFTGPQKSTSSGGLMSVHVNTTLRTRPIYQPF